MRYFCHIVHPVLRTTTTTVSGQTFESLLLPFLFSLYLFPHILTSSFPLSSLNSSCIPPLYLHSFPLLITLYISLLQFFFLSPFRHLSFLSDLISSFLPSLFLSLLLHHLSSVPSFFPHSLT